MKMTKAILKETGEIVTLHYKDPKNGKWSILESNIREFSEDELRIIDDMQSFLEAYMTDYYHDDGVAESDDISCCLDHDADDEKLKRVIELYGSTPEEWMAYQLTLDLELLKEARDNYMKRLKSNK